MNRTWRAARGPFELVLSPFYPCLNLGAPKAPLVTGSKRWNLAQLGPQANRTSGDSKPSGDIECGEEYLVHYSPTFPPLLWVRLLTMLKREQTFHGTKAIMRHFP
jgi:hypothetical protein